MSRRGGNVLDLVGSAVSTPVSAIQFGMKVLILARSKAQKCLPLGLPTMLLACVVGALVLGGCDAPGPATAQPTPAQSVVGGGIDGPDGWQGAPAKLSWQDTSPGWTQPGQRIKLTGTIFQPDGRTPAPGVVLYYYHTNTQGRYIHDPSEPRSMPPNELGQTHGAIRGWVKTGADGRYEILTVRPGTYPTRDAPDHVHATIKEPDLAALGRELGLKHVALTFVPSVTDEASEVALNRISPDVGSTMILYRRSRVIGTMLDAKPTPENFAQVRERLDRTRNEYFDVPK